MHELRTEPRQRRSRQSIDAILDAAERLIHEQGQVCFTAAELAASADMSIGRVYYWFPDIPSVVGALVERSVERMVKVFGDAVASESRSSTPLLVHRVVSVLCQHIDNNPATVALSLSGGEQRHGVALHRSMVELVEPVVTDRVPEVPAAEAELVANTIVGIMLGMLNGYTRAAEYKATIRQELIFVLSAWLYARYPHPDDQVWNNPAWPLQPSRKPRLGFTDTGPVWPALAPTQPSFSFT